MLKGNYRYPAIKAAQYRRLKAIKHPEWVTAMAAVIKRQKFLDGTTLATYKAKSICKKL